MKSLRKGASRFSSRVGGERRAGLAPSEILPTARFTRGITSSAQGMQASRHPSCLSSMVEFT